MAFGGWNITGYTPGCGRRPLNSRMFAGQFNSNLRGVNIFGYGGGTHMTINNYGDYGCYHDSGFSMPSWMGWLMGGGMLANLLGSVISLFSGGGGGGSTVGGADKAEKKDANESLKNDIEQYRKIYENDCTISDPLSDGKVMIKGKNKVGDTYPVYTVDAKDLRAKLEELYASGEPKKPAKPSEVDDGNVAGNGGKANKPGNVAGPDDAAAAGEADGVPKDEIEFNAKWGDNARLEKIPGGTYNLTYTGNDGKPVRINLNDIAAAEKTLSDDGIEPPKEAPGTTSTLKPETGKGKIAIDGPITIKIANKNDGISYAFQRALKDKGIEINGNLKQWENAMAKFVAGVENNNIWSGGNDIHKKGNAYKGFRVSPGQEITIPAATVKEMLTELGYSTE